MHKYGNPTHVLTLNTPLPAPYFGGVMVEKIYAVLTNRAGGTFYTPRLGFHTPTNIVGVETVSVSGVPETVFDHWDFWVQK